MVTPSALALKKIADALDVTTDYLLGNEVASTIKDTALLKQFKKVDQRLLISFPKVDRGIMKKLNH
ncbi:hypothetical protein KO526_09065 [Reichenbachiella agariperforans]|nr:hypothetical protein [Reichenbachiella agariperforans]